MAQEISLTVEETNKLRVSIGLKPISEPNITKKTDATPDSTTYELSLEDTNKLRISIGLKPIPSDTQASRVTREVDNFDDHQEKSRLKSQEDEVRRRVEDAKMKTHRQKQISKRTLVDGDNIDSDNWLDNLGKPKPKKSRKQNLAHEYDKEHDLSGVKIGHSAKELGEMTQDEILTLKDKDILDDDDSEDELNNDRLVRKDALTKELAEKAEADNVKFNGRHHVGFQEDQDDKEIDQENLIISGSSINIPRVQEVAKPRGISIDSLFSDHSGTEEIQNDYSRAKPVKMKKLKKKSTLKSRSKTQDDELKHVELETYEDNMDEELELESILSKKRRIKQTKRTRMTPEQIADEVELFKRWEIENEIHPDTGIVFDDASDFLSSLNVPILNDVNIKKEDEYESRTNEPQIKKEDVDESQLKDTKQSKETVINESDKLESDKLESDKLESDKIESDSENESTTKSFNGGIASTLQFLQSRNILNKNTTEQNMQQKQRREAAKQSELLKLKISIEERLLKEELEADRTYMNLSKVERVQLFEKALDSRLKEKNIIGTNSPHPNKHGSRSKSFRQKSPASGSLNLTSYNPTIKLSYRDNTGKELDTKGAFKYLSHQFHGVTKAAPEKTVKKEETDLNGSII